MPSFLLDSNIVLGILREAVWAKMICDKHNLLALDVIASVSVVTKAELLSLAYQLGWQTKRISRLTELMQQLPIVDINHPDIIQAYAEIDAFSQGKLSSRPLGTSARNMGKNDLWIAATASVAGATLLTTDNDFDHLHGIFLTIEKVVTK